MFVTSVVCFIWDTKPELPTYTSQGRLGFLHVSAQAREMNKTKGTKYIMYIQNNILILKKNKKHQENKNQGGECGSRKDLHLLLIALTVLLFLMGPLVEIEYHSCMCGRIGWTTWFRVYWDALNDCVCKLEPTRILIWVRKRLPSNEKIWRSI